MRVEQSRWFLFCAFNMKPLLKVESQRSKVTKHLHFTSFSFFSHLQWCWDSVFHSHLEWEKTSLTVTIVVVICSFSYFYNCLFLCDSVIYLWLQFSRLFPPASPCPPPCLWFPVSLLLEIGLNFLFSPLHNWLVGAASTAGPGPGLSVWFL